MADRRRRRRRASQDSEDDDESGSGSDSGKSGSPSTKGRGRDPDPVEAVANRIETKSDVESECESEDGVGEAVLSDYDSADPEETGSRSEGEQEAEQYSDEEAPPAGEPQQLTAEEQTQQEQQQEAGNPEEAEGPGGGGNKEENKGEEKGNLAGERQSGDGQESTDDPETKAGVKAGQQLDDDEDRKNPAYIPRKGLFFEHDVRGHAQEEERPKGRNRKLWKDEGRWEHDKFREEEQAPKSREELIAIYGYDIRNGGGGERVYRQRRPRQCPSPSRDKRWRDGGAAERPVRSWHSGGGVVGRGAGPPPSSLPPSSSQRSCASSRAPPPRSRPPHHSQPHLPPAPQCKTMESNAPHVHSRERPGGKDPSEQDKGVAGKGGRGGRGGPPLLIEDIGGSHRAELPHSGGATTAAQQGAGYQSVSPRRLQEQHADWPPSSSEPAPQAPAPNREASPPVERPVERKSYSLARRTRSRPADLGSKQASVEESAGGAASPGATAAKNWAGGGEAGSQAGGGAGGAGLAELDQDVARLSLAGPNWSPTSYIRSELRGLPSTLHLPAAPPQFPNMEEMGVGANRAKRYSSQRQRTVPEPAPGPPLHLGVMEGHYYEPMSYQGPIYAHGDGPNPLPPQGMLVQPEMHLPHPGLHPHQSPGGPIANPTLYGAPPVSLSPGQPQQLLPPPFYPPPGVMTFPYPAMYPSPQGQSQVTYGGVTYYDTVQQQAQPKPSPPRRTSQPVTVKPPPPEVPYASE